jgi:hypothetical protein
MKTFLTTLICLSAGLALRGADLPEAQKIDSILAKEWEKNNLKPNAPAPDAIMVRRIYLDLVGRIPTVQETQEFIKSTDSQKRAKLIDQLLASDGYTSTMFNYWADILRMTDNVKGKLTAEAYAEYIKRCLKENKPYDQFVRDLITTDGGVWDSGAIGFYMRDDNKLDHLAYTTQVFLGTSIVCAQCHNHPFDKWTQKDYYGLASYTYGMETKGYSELGFGKGSRPGGSFDKAQLKNLKNASPEERRKFMAEHEAELRKAREQETQKPSVSREDMKLVQSAMKDIMKPLRYTNTSWNEKNLPRLPSDYKYPDAKPGEAIQPKTIFGHDAVPAEGQSKLQAFAEWMTSPENPRFSMVVANRMWKKVFGLGLIEPVDEITDSTVASNPELMDYLTQLVIDKNYSLKSVLRVLYNTDTYQLMATKKEVALGEPYHFTGPLLRRMSAEQVWDSFVVLAKGNVDSETSEENERLHQYLADLKMFTGTMRDQGPEGLVEIAKKAKEGTDGRTESEVRKEILVAQKAGDKERARKLTQEADRIRRQGNSDIIESLVGHERAKEMRQGYNPRKGAKNEPEIIDRAALAALSKEERREAIKMGGSMNLTHRASEISSPAKPGHFLRTFGQSDREVISNASDEASVPQALALLNGPVSEVLNSPLSKLRQDLAKSTSTADKVDLLYLSLLSRSPMGEEKKILSNVIAERGDKAVADVTHALVTGSQFLFIQ